jgi:hypothetical protein
MHEILDEEYMTVIRMGIKRRSIKLEPHRNRKTAQHLVANYSVSAKHVDCECGWDGPEEEFQAHRKSMGASKSQRRKANAEALLLLREMG